eukprot:jgi/Pico_ML_1/54719/g592.t1
MLFWLVDRESSLRVAFVVLGFGFGSGCLEGCVCFVFHRFPEGQQVFQENEASPKILVLARSTASNPSTSPFSSSSSTSPVLSPERIDARIDVFDAFRRGVGAQDQVEGTSHAFQDFIQRTARSFGPPRRIRWSPSCARASSGSTAMARRTDGLASTAASNPSPTLA